MLRRFAEWARLETPFQRKKIPLDTSAFVRYLAVSMFVGDFDGYRHSHNYRIYFDPGVGKWFFIPWGLDRTFTKELQLYDSQGWLAKQCFAMVIVDANISKRCLMLSRSFRL